MPFRTVGKKNRNKNTAMVYTFVIFSVLFVSFSGVFLNLSANQPLFSTTFFLFFCGAIAVLGIYAYLWQIVLRKLPLSVAYAFKATSTVWSFLWAYLFFGNPIRIQNIIGGGLIVLGSLLAVNSDE